MSERRRFHPVELYRNARQRVNPEGLAISTTISTASLGVIVPMEAGITYVLHEVGKEVDPNILKFATIALLGIANMASVAIEAKTLKKKQYSSSPIGSTLNVATGKPLLSTVGELAFNHAQLTVFNPINAVAIANSDSQLLAESVAATSFTLSAWSIPMNTLILQGRIDPVVNKMREARQWIWGGIKNKIANFGQKE